MLSDRYAIKNYCSTMEEKIYTEGKKHGFEFGYENSFV